MHSKMGDCAAGGGGGSASMTTSQHLLDELSSKTWPEQRDSNQRVEDVFNARHPFAALLKAFLDGLIPETANLLMRCKPCICSVYLVHAAAACSGARSQVFPRTLYPYLFA